VLSKISVNANLITTNPTWATMELKMGHAVRRQQLTDCTVAQPYEAIMLIYKPDENYFSTAVLQFHRNRIFIISSKLLSWSIFSILLQRTKYYTGPRSNPCNGKSM
jgi:hypothetical protein